MKINTLNNLNIGEEAIIKSNNIKTKNKQNIINLGVTEGTKVKCLYQSPLKDPTAYLIKNVILAIREEDAKLITITGENNGSN